jgi:cysteine-rich repeat protein
MTRSDRMQRFAILFSAAAFAVVLAASPAAAICGDGVIDGAELCDDGNLADGDCCSSSCGRPDYCVATDRSSIIYRDYGDDRLDKIFWKYMRGPTTFEDFGDPTAETGYAFCMWDDDRLVIDSFVENSGFCFPNRPCWKIVGRVDPSAYKYFDKPSNDTGVQRLLISRRSPPQNAYISIRLDGIDINPPGPIGFDQYFNQTEAVTVQFLRDDAPVCWEATFRDNKRNDYKRFKAYLTPAKVADP